MTCVLLLGLETLTVRNRDLEMDDFNLTLLASLAIRGVVLGRYGV